MLETRLLGPLRLSDDLCEVLLTKDRRDVVQHATHQEGRCDNVTARKARIDFFAHRRQKVRIKLFGLRVGKSLNYLIGHNKCVDIFMPDMLSWVFRL